MTTTPDAPPVPPRHPAKFGTPILERLDDVLRRTFAGRAGRVLDPFAGTGRIHDVCEPIGLDSVGIELEPEWAAIHPRTIVGNALALPFPDDTFDAIVTSPCYGNRMADAHDAQERCRQCVGTGHRLGHVNGTPCDACQGTGTRGHHRNTYTHVLGRRLHRDNTGAMQWGPKYRNTHRAAWAEAIRVLRPGGVFVLNTKDFDRTRRGAVERVHLTEWHHGVLRFSHEATKIEDHPVPVRGLRDGANRDRRVDHETVAVFRLPR